jgi:hypothetical protein
MSGLINSTRLTDYHKEGRSGRTAFRKTGWLLLFLALLCLFLFGSYLFDSLY